MIKTAASFLETSLVFGLAQLAGCGNTPVSLPQDFETAAYDRLFENLTDKGIVPSRVHSGQGQYNDEACDAAETNGASAGNHLPDDTTSRAANWTGLNSVLDSVASPSQLKVALINIKRVQGKPYSRYYSNGTQNDSMQTWSVSKPLAFAAMASQLRGESGGQVGIDGTTENTNGQGGKVPIGDLVSIATVYRTSVSPYNSNNLGSWAQNVSGRAHSSKLINVWLGRNNESFGGGYGDYGSGLKPLFWSSSGVQHKSTMGDNGAGENRLSPLSRAEFYRRVALHRELVAIDQAKGTNLCDTSTMASLSLPCVTWPDMRTILYGTNPSSSRFLKDKPVGGMLAGMSSFVQRAASGSKPELLNKLYGGRWRVFTKVGWGLTNGLPDTRFDAYACFPKYGSEGQRVAGGREFVLSVSLLPSANLTTAKADILIQRAVNALVAGLFDGTILRN